MKMARLGRILRLRMRSLTRRERTDTELGAELAFHLDQLAAEHVAEGMSVTEAREAARRSFGNLAVIEGECRDHRGLRWLHDFWQDSRYGLRMLRASKTFTITAVVSLALALGGNTAVLGVAESVFHGALPFADPDRLVIVRTFPLNSPDQLAGVSLADYLAWHERARSFESMGASLSNQQDIDFDGGIEHVQGQAFTPDLFQALEAAPLLGRTFTAQDTGPVVVLSDKLWRNRFASDPRILDRSVRMNGRLTRIIGVMPPDFHYITDNAQYWVPMHPHADLRNESARFFLVGARLRPEATLGQAQAEMSALARERDRDWGVRLISVREALFGWMMRSLYTIEAGVALLLLIACGNVSVLLLARMAARSSEMALRAALGAGRGRLIRQMLAESLLLGSLGTLFGMPLAWWGLHLAPLLTPQPGGTHLALPVLTARILLAALGVAFLSSLLLGGLTAMSRVDPFTSQRSGGGGFRGAILSAQVAIALVLLTGAGLLTKSFVRLSMRGYNFNTRSLASFDYRIPVQEFAQRNGQDAWFQPHPSEMIERVFEKVRERVRAVPGARVAGISHQPVNSLVVPRLTARVDASDAEYPVVNLLVTADYFKTIEAEFVAGRDIGDSDTGQRPLVAVVNQTLALRLWPGQNPLHKRLGIKGIHEGAPVEVVGVVRDIPLRSASAAAEAVLYTPFLQQPSVIHGPWESMFGQMTFVMRGRSTADLLQAAKNAAADADPSHPISGEGTVEGRIHGRTREGLFYVAAFLTMAAIAGFLAAVGLYGTTAYLVERRRKEIGIRIAVGASRENLVAMLTRWALVVTGEGAAAGILGSLAISRLLEPQLWGVEPGDPAVLAAVLTTLLLTAFLAALLPSLRATRIDPALILRVESAS
jgi:predicted permease